MKVGITAEALSSKGAGIGTYDYNLIKNLNEFNECRFSLMLYENDILFLNWQKVVQDSAASRKLKIRTPKDERFKKEKGSYFEDVIAETKKDQRREQDGGQHCGQ